MNIDDAWLTRYFDKYRSAAFDVSVYPSLQQFAALAVETRAKGGKLIFAGNGASAAIAAHGSVDFTKQGKVTAINFNEADLITCFANDFGYDAWMAKAIEHYAAPEDVVVLISVSGMSPSVVNAAQFARAHSMPVVGFTGRSPDNDLRGLSDIDFWFDSHAYNIVECVHMIWLTTVIDMVVGSAEYEVS